MDLHTGLGRRELQLLPNPPYSARADELRKEIFEVNGLTIQETGGRGLLHVSRGLFGFHLPILRTKIPDTDMREHAH